MKKKTIKQLIMMKRILEIKMKLKKIRKKKEKNQIIPWIIQILINHIAINILMI